MTTDNIESSEEILLPPGMEERIVGLSTELHGVKSDFDAPPPDLKLFKVTVPAFSFGVLASSEFDARIQLDGLTHEVIKGMSPVQATIEEASLVSFDQETLDSPPTGDDVSDYGTIRQILAGTRDGLGWAMLRAKRAFGSMGHAQYHVAQETAENGDWVSGARTCCVGVLEYSDPDGVVCKNQMFPGKDATLMFLVRGLGTTWDKAFESVR